MKKYFYSVFTALLIFGPGIFCFAQPVISVNPSFLNETINSCNDSVTKTLTIGNSGSADLNYSLEILPSPTEAIFYDGFESGNFSGWNIEAGAYSRTVTTTSPAAGTYCFEQTGGNGLYLDGISHSFPATQSNYISFKIKSPLGSPTWNCGVNIGNSSDIQANGAIGDSWIDNGSGTVYMWCTSGTYTFPMIQGQWYTIEYRNINYTTKTFDYYVNGNLVGSNLVFANTNITNIDVVHLFGWTGGATSFYDDIFISRNANEWILPSVLSGTVTPSGSNIVNVKLKSTFIQSGTHIASILVKSNDPITPLVTVPCTLTVNGSENINMPLSGSCHKFDTIMLGGTDQDTFLIENLGCDTLFITNVTSSTSQFTINSYPPFVPGYEAGYLLASFAPTSTTGNKTANITVFNSDLDTTFCVEGTALPAPIIGISPSSFNVTIPTCNDSVTQTLTINNTGAVNLNANLVPGVTYLGASFGYGYICNAGTNNVSVINSETNTIVATIPVGTFPWRAAIRPDSKFVYVCNRNSNNISVINTATNTVFTTIALGGNPGGIAFTKDSKFAYVADRTNGNVKKIDCSTNTIIATINSPNFSDPQDIAITPNGTRAFVCTQNTGITVIDLATDAVIGNIPGSNGAHSIIFTPDGSKAYISEPWSDQVRVVNVPAISTITFIFGFDEPHGLDITRDGSMVYVLDKWNNQIDVISVATNTIINTITDPRLNNGWDLILSHKEKYVYVSNPFPGNANEDVMIYERTTLNSLGTLSTGTGTRGMATIKEVYGSFMNVAPATTTVTPSGSTNIAVEFNGLNLPSGTYISDLSIYSNDPVNPLILVPCTLNITAPADFEFIGLSDTIAPLCLDMDSIMAYTSSTDTIYIRNTGCDSLTLDGLTFNPAQFSLDTAAFPIAPGEEGGIVVLFSPTAPGTYSGTASINTNDLDTTICLFGKAFAPPVIGVTPTSFTVTVNCIDTVQDTLFIANTGGSTLNYLLSENTPGGAYDSTVTKNLTTSNQISNIIYTSVPYSDSLYLTVTLNGDYDSGSEYAELYIDGTYIGIITDYNQLNTNMNFNYAFGGAQVLTWLADGQITVTLDNTSSVGSGGFHRSRLIIPGMAWLSLAPISGTVPVGSTDTVLVEFNSNNLLAGQYTGTVFINSNDPVNNPVQVPCTLNVVGSPDFHLAALGDTIAPLCLNMDSIMAFSNSRDTIFITNLGCDSLVLDSIKFSPSIFSLDTFTASILPGDTGGVVVVFTPLSVGSFSGTVTIYTNDIDTTVCLKGKAYPQPILCLNPDTFNITLGCNTYTTVPMIVCNSGGSDLNFALTALNGFCGTSGNTRVGVYNNATITAMLNTQPDLTATTLSSYNAATLANYDVLMNIRNGNLDQTAVLNWISNGGTWIGEWSSNTIPITNWGAIAGTAGGSTSGSMSVSINDATHYLAQNINWASMPVGTNPCDFMYDLNITDPAAKTIINVNHSSFGINPLLVEKKYGQGKIILFNWDYNDDPNYNAVVQDMIQEVVRYAGGGTEWLCPDTLSGTVASNDTNIVNVTFNTDNLIIGQYTTTITVNSNDPLNNPVNIPVTLNVVGAAQANYFLFDSIGTCLDLDSIMAFTSSTDTIAISNTGCDTLFIDSLKYSSPMFSTAYSAGYILPGDTNGVVVQFLPTSTGTITATVTVYTNDNDPVICLYGEAFPQPVISFTPDTFEITLSCNDTITDTLFISNNGGSNLNWSLFTGQDLSDNFNPSINGSMWSFNNGIPNTNCGSVSGNALWMGDASTRIAATIDLNTFGGGTLDFYLKIAGTGSNCETADGGEDVVLEYSNNGGGIWNLVATYFTGSYSNFTPINVAIPPAAQTASTRFRWRQLSHSGNCCDHWALDNILISTMSNCAANVCINPTTGNTPPSATDTVYVEFNSTGLLNGQHVSSITIISNDPLNSPDTIPVILNVVGTPQANLFLLDSLGTCLDLDSIMAFTISTDTIVIFNTGCDTLFIDSLKFTPPAIYSAVYAANYILPGDTNGVVVQFAPVATGTVTGTVTIYTNDTDPTICLHGEAYPRPIQTHAPNSYSVTIGCNDTIVNALTINNTGGSDLHYALSGAYETISFSQPFVQGQAPNASVLAAWNSFKSQLTPHPYTSLKVSGSNNPTGVTLTDTAAIANIAQAMNTMTPYSVTTGGNTWTVGINACGSGVLLAVNAPNCNCDGAAGNLYLFRPEIGSSNWGGINTPTCNGPSQTMNIDFTWGYPWFQLNPVADTVAPSATSTVTTTFISTGMTIGTYTTNVIISSNDPLNVTDTIPVTLNVVGTANANYALFDSTGNCLDLDSIMESTTSRDTIAVYNTGCDTLFITGLNFSHAAYSAVSYPGMVLPNDTNFIIVQFAPVSTGTITCNLTITTNDGSPVLCLYGESFAKPVQCHSPNSFYEHFLVCQDTLLDTLVICNTGAGSLNYSLWSPFGISAQFDGANDYIRTGINISGQFSNETVTEEVWFKANAAGVIISEIGQTSINTGWHDSHIEVLSTGQVYVRVWGLGSVNVGTVSFGTWNHVVLRYNKATLTLDGFLNGVEAATDATGDRSAPWESGYGQYFALGATDGTHMGSGAYFNGKIEEFRVWNTARTNAQIQANMNKSLIGNEAGLVTYWKFDDSTATDGSSVANHGTLAGGTLITENVEFIPASTGTVSPSGSYSVQVIFTKAGLAPGTHNFPIYLHSNDPLNAVDTVNVTFDIDAAAPSPTAGSNSPVCQGTDLSLTASTISGATYSWTGPNSFTSSLQNPVITAASTAASGTYSVTASVSGCPQGAAGTTSVVVNSAPSVPTAGSNGTVCTGKTLTLTASAISGATYAWTGPNSFTSSLQNPSITNVSTSAAGTYSVTASVPGCPPTAAGTTTVVVNLTPSAPTASSNSPVCAGNDLSLTASTVGSSTYAWTGPSSFTASTQNPVLTPATTAATGTYSVTAIENGCSSSAGTTVATINPPPAAPTAGSNSTVCSGRTLSLTASTISGASYAWTGPNSFTASVQNPTIANVTSASAGTYSVTATVGGCPPSTAGTVTVVINPTPAAPSASSNSPVCVGVNISLSASTVGSSTYAWTGPASFTASVQNPVVTGVTTAKAGTYSVTATEAGCTGPAGTTTVVVNSPPAAPTVSSNSPVCVGLNLSLTASTISGASYAWNGPNSYTASVQNPVLNGVSTANAGTYSVIATVNGCTGTAGTATVIVNPAPAVPTAGSNSTVCSGQTLSLTASSTGSTYSWTGPNNFTSTLQNPTIAGVTTAGNGTYSVSAIVGGCPPSSPGTTPVTINQTPSAPTVTSNSPVCAGNNLSLTASTILGASYSWSGPNSFTDVVQNPSITGVTVAGTGTYSVNATVAGCTGPIGTTSVTVNPPPGPPTAGNNGTLCSGQTLSLTASTVSGAAYTWMGPNSFTSSLQNPTITNISTAANGTYSVYVLVGGCPPSAAGTTTVTIYQTPAAPTAGSNSPVCVGSDISLSASTIAGVSYAWTGPASFTASTQNPVITSALTTMSGTYSVSASQNGCTGPKGTVAVVVNTPPGTPTAGSNGTICSGQTLSLTANSISGATYAWTGPNTFTASVQNPSITGVSTAAAGTYSVNATVPGCAVSGTGTISVVVNQSPAAPSAGSNAPVCSGSTLSLTASTVGTSTYSWSGPASFTSTVQNPTLGTVTTTMAGTYSVTATENGCPSPAGTTSVTIYQTPAAPSAGNNSPLCSGQTLSLTASNITGATYSWSGPNSYTSTLQNPTLAGISTSDAGVYSVNATVNGCTGSAGTTTVSVNPTPAPPTAGSNSQVCSGQTLSLTASTVSGAVYVWTGPNSFTSSLEDPTISNVTTAGNGTYSVSASVSGCGSSVSTTSVVINQTPAAPSAGSNSPVCVGVPLSLTASTISGATYAWTGPNGFTDASQDPVVSSASTSNAGTYSVTATINGCTGAASTTSVTINLPPSVPAAGNNSTVCSGQTLSLTASTVSGATYSWTGPDNFTSTLQNPAISAVTTAANGTYSVSAILGGCPPSAPGTTTATINQTPGAPAAGANSPVCVGFTLSLTASTAGTAYAWNGPAGFTSSSQDPTVTNVTTANAGTYSVTATTAGCTGPAGTTSVIVNTIPAAPTAANQSGCFGGTIPSLTASGTNIQWYDDLGGFAGSGSPFSTGQSAVGTYTYTATQTVNGCTSPSTTVTLTINALPATPNAGSDITICYGVATPTFTATGSNVTWYDGAGTPVGTGNAFVPGATAPGSYTFVATQTNTVTTCESAGDMVIFTINSIAPPVAPDVAVCFGSPTPPLVATGTAIQWFDVNNTLVSTANTYTTGLTAAGTYTFYVSQTNTVTTCSSPKDTVYLIISNPPSAAPLVADAAICFGVATPTLTATSGTIINWHTDAALTNEVFSGNPFNTGLTAPGSYTFFATDSTPGCGEGPSDAVLVTIHTLPATLSINDTASCFGTTAPALITIGNNIQWYNSLLAVVSVNDTFVTGQTAIGTYTYYVTQTNTVTTCESLKDTVQLTIHALPAKPLALDTTVCSAATIPNLTSTGTNVQWYNSSGTFVFTGNSYATGQTTPGAHMYFAADKDGVTGCESVRDTSVLTILLSPPVPVANNVAVCSGNPIPALTSTGTNPKWYSDASLTTLVHTGNSYNTGQTAVGVYTYYVTDSLSGCVSSSSDSATLTINAAPAKPVANNVTICYGGAAVLTTTGANPQWYSDATLINMVGTGSTFNTGLTGVGTYTYYVTDFAPGCGNSPSDTVVIRINPNPLVTANTYSTTITQGDSIQLTAYNAISYTWTPPAGLSSTTGSSVMATPTVTTTYTVTGMNSYGCSNSVSILVVVDPLGVASLTHPVQDVNIYPNPAVGSFTLEFNTSLETPIAIYMVNMLGDKVRFIQGVPSPGSGLVKHKYSIDTGTLTEGVYNVEIVTDQGTVNRRVILFR